MKNEDIELKTMLEQVFAAGQGVVTLSVNMTDEQILTLIKGACTWSKVKVFQVIPPQAQLESPASSKPIMFIQDEGSGYLGDGAIRPYRNPKSEVKA